MNQSLNCERRSRIPSQKYFWLLVLNRNSIALGGILLLGLFAGSWRLWSFIHDDLTPLAQKSLTSTLNRPVKLGQVKEISLSGVKFAASAIPATPTDPDSVTVDSVEVGFDLWQLLFHRHLKLDVTLVNPNIHLEQDEQGHWITTNLAKPGKNGPVQTQLDKLRFRNGQLTLVPNPQWRIQQEEEKKSFADGTAKDNKQKTNYNSALLGKFFSPLAFSQLNGTAQLLENNDLIKFDITGQATSSGGSIALQGDIRLTTLLTNLKIQGQQLLASDITRLVKLPVALLDGRVSSDLRLQARLGESQPPLLFGSVGLQNVRMQLPQLPQPLLDSRGTLRFQNTQIKLDNFVTSYGAVPLVVSGAIDSKTGYNLSGRIEAVSVETVQRTLKLKSPVPVSGQLKADLQLVGKANNPILYGTVTTIKPARIDKVDFSSVRGKFEYSLPTGIVVLKDIQGQMEVGGKIGGTGKLQLGTIPQLDLHLTAKNVPGDAIAHLYNSQIPFAVGAVSGTAKVTGTVDKLQTLVEFQAPQAQYPTTGEILIAGDRHLSFRNVAVSVAGGRILAAGNWNQKQWKVVARASQIPIENFLNQSQLQNISLKNAFFDGDLIVSGTSNSWKITNIATQNARVQLAGGKVAISKVQMKEKSFSVQLIAEGVQLGRLLPNSPPALQAALAGKFQISGNTDSLNLKTLQGNGSARLTLWRGTVSASHIKLADGIYQAQLQARDIQVAQLASLPQQLQGTLSGEFQVAGSVTSLQPKSLQASGQARLNIAGGRITATNIQLANGRYQAVVDATDVELNRWQPQLQGKLGGKIQVAGNAGTFNLAELQASGQLQFSQGLAGVHQPLTATVAWDGQKLLVRQASARDFNASGYILTKASSGVVPEITELALQVQAKNYNLQNLPFQLPNTVNVQGKADFSGQIAGKLPTPDVVGKLILKNFAVNRFAFEPVLTGNIQSLPSQGLDLDVTGTHDKIAFHLDANYRPRAFNVQWQKASASGQLQGDTFIAKVENFPLIAWDWSIPATTFLNAGKLAGLLSGDLQIKQNTWETMGNIAIEQPRLARIFLGDRLLAQFRYENGKVTLNNSTLIKGNSRYTMAGTFTPTATKPLIQGKLTVNQGQIQDVLTALQIFELKDLQRGFTPPTYGKASDLQTVAVGLPNESLQAQIQRFSEIKALLTQQQQQRRQTSFLPDLADLKGTFNGEVTVDTATNNNLAVKFDFNGENFVWGRPQEDPEHFYAAEQVIAKGSFENGVLRLLPLRLQSNNSLIAFTGNIGGTEQSGQLRIKNPPLELLNNYVKLPVGLTGNINATATVAGSIANPQARGELQITQGTLNRKGIESANASFSYNDGRLNFGSSVVVSGLEPVAITGSIPYKLPFASVRPDSNQLSLDVKVKKEGLTVLNILTDQLTFEKGEGDLNLTVSGTTQQPILNGVATIKGATFAAAQALPGKLTDVTGKIEFNFDRIKVDSLQGKFSKGSFTAQGEIPIFNPQQSTDNPLNIYLHQLAINLREKYQGGINGNLQITGSAFSPIIGGELKLSHGQVFIAQSANASSNASKSQEEISLRKAIREPKSEVGTAVTRFHDLEIVLGKNVEITLPPILSFRATGSVKVNGTLNKPEPEGTIRLQDGDVNLFATQFNLARGYKHTAIFRGNQDPDLDIRLVTNILDANPMQVASSAVASEINDGIITNFNPVNTVRVEATIDGPASQINQNLELKSNPSYTKAEIVTMLGGSFVETLGRGDATLGLVNLASSALNLQRTFNEIGNAFGLSELRLFPTITFDSTNTTKRNPSSIDLAMEAGVDISRNFFFSALKILTNDKPPQFGINYRLNSQWRLRTSTDLAGDDRAVLEYEDRF